MTLPVFADVDTGVDDAVALVYLLASADARLVGLACTGGNVAVQQVCHNSMAVLELCGAPGVPLSRGADAPLNGPVSTAEAIHGPQGLGYAELPPGRGQLTGYDAAAAWVAAARAHPGRLIGVVTGPLTNLALALRAEPALPTLLRRLVIMGGAYSGERSGWAEFNIGFDPEAADEVFAGWGAIAPQRLPIVCGLDLTRHIAITPAVLELLPAPADSPVTRLLDDALRFYFEAHDARGHGYLAYLHDPLAAAVALEPDLVTTRPAAIRVELAGTAARGRTIPDWDAPRPNALIGVGVDPAAFFERFVLRVGALARRLDGAPAHS